MKKYLKYVPNILTVIRFCFVPIIIALLSQGNYIGAIITFSLSGVTDILDGAIARKYNLVSDFGKLMDPLADKITQLSMLLMLTIKHIIPIWIIVVVATKEFLMVCGASFLYGKEMVVSSRWYGKLATVLFYVAIVISLVLKQFEATILEKQILGTSDKSILLYAAHPFYYIAILMTIFSLANPVKVLLPLVSIQRIGKSCLRTMYSTS